MPDSALSAATKTDSEQALLNHTLRRSPYADALAPFPSQKSPPAPELTPPPLVKDHADPSSKISDMFAKQRPSQTGDLRNLVETSNAFSKNRERRDVTQKDLAATHQTDSYVQQMTRRWKKGDVYAPKDLSPVEMRRWKGFLTPQVDIVDVMGFNPVDNYRVCLP